MNSKSAKLRQKEVLSANFKKEFKQFEHDFPFITQNIPENASFETILAHLEHYKKNDPTALQVKEKLNILRLELLCIQWIKTSESLQKLETSRQENKIQAIPQDKIISLREKSKELLKEMHVLLQAAPLNSPEFIHDIQSKLQEKSVSKTLTNKVVIETDDPIDFLLCGTEVDGSCQRIDGDPNLNKGLLGYTLDGKNKILAIKNAEDSSGKILARCLLRLLWDGTKPILFMERFYPDNISVENSQALIHIAQEKAKHLNIPLLSLEGKGSAYGKPLISLGSSAPWEYCDGSSGITQGKYEIKATHFVEE